MHKVGAGGFHVYVIARPDPGDGRSDNADGSRTYVLDLSSISAGTAVNLSFDLIGFGL